MSNPTTETVPTRPDRVYFCDTNTVEENPCPECGYDWYHAKTCSFASRDCPGHVMSRCKPEKENK